jgi:hypothetical protein
VSLHKIRYVVYNEAFLGVGIIIFNFLVYNMCPVNFYMITLYSSWWFEWLWWNYLVCYVVSYMGVPVFLLCGSVSTDHLPDYMASHPQRNVLFPIHFIFRLCSQKGMDTICISTNWKTYPTNTTPEFNRLSKIISIVILYCAQTFFTDQ